MQPDKIYALIKGKIKDTERLIAQQMESDVAVITRMGNHLVESGGKRIRPALLQLCAAACGYEGNKDVRYGMVFEFVHTATLIHDDIIDNAELRRGKQVIHRKYGTTLSILFGDYVYNSAMAMALRDDDFRIVRLICEATAKMIEGEIIQAERNYSIDLSLGDYLDLISRKTAYLFSSCAQAGAILSEAGVDVEKELRNYGLNLGIAFQLIDDYFDYASSSKKLGKPVGSDLQEGKITFPVLLLIERTGSKALDVVKDAFSRKSVTESEMAFLLASMKECNALQDTRKEAKEYAQKAIDSLTMFKSSPYLDALKALPEFVVERNK